jgi:hypothetical protein
MRSLFIVSLPRSLSSDVFHLAQRGMGFRVPVWVSEGEVLNVDRYAHHGGERFDQGAKFTTSAHDPVLHAQLLGLLDQVTVDEGFVYKDVIQPFVISAWLRNGRFHVIRIKRDLTDVAYSMLVRGWFYPRFAAQQQPRASMVRLWLRLFHMSGRLYHSVLPVLFRSRLAAAVIEGLERAERALDAMPGTHVQFDDLIASEDCARQMLESLYPTERISLPSYIDGAFRCRRADVLSRRETAVYRSLAAQVRKLYPE